MTTHAEPSDTRRQAACRALPDSQQPHGADAARGPMREVALGVWDLGYTSEQVYRDGESRDYRAP